MAANLRRLSTLVGRIISWANTAFAHKPHDVEPKSSSTLQEKINIGINAFGGFALGLVAPAVMDLFLQTTALALRVHFASGLFFGIAFGYFEYRKIRKHRKAVELQKYTRREQQEANKQKRAHYNALRQQLGLNTVHEVIAIGEEAQDGLQTLKDLPDHEKFCAMRDAILPKKSSAALLEPKPEIEPEVSLDVYYWQVCYALFAPPSKGRDAYRKSLYDKKLDYTPSTETLFRLWVNKTCHRLFIFTIGSLTPWSIYLTLASILASLPTAGAPLIALTVLGFFSGLAYVAHKFYVERSTQQKARSLAGEIQELKETGHLLDNTIAEYEQFLIFRGLKPKASPTQSPETAAMLAAMDNKDTMPFSPANNSPAAPS